MPNGHGGIPRFGGPLFYAVLAAVASHSSLHFWGADDYGGAYTSAEKYRRAALRYYGFAVLYAAAGAAAVLAIFW